MPNSNRAPRDHSGVSRREFLKGSGAAAAATALAVGPEQIAEAAPPKKPRAFGSGPATIILQVNTKSYEIKVEPRTTLLEVLRYKLNLTGAKPVDTDGSSGASTVLVAGKPVNASNTLAVSCIGVEIQTVEGLGKDKPDPVVSAFVAHDASQCGFCTPGFVMAVKAFVEKNPRPTEKQIRSGLGGNLCRCGTYANIIQAVESLAKGASNG
jgi:xanthine dehydrogenase YagT iron-sulfur-binding subunit